MDLERTPTVAEYLDQLRALDVVAPVFEVDARRSRDVSLLIQALLLSIDHGIREQ
jgi:hypothetical protein